jgi:hypothetical protein
VFLWEFHLAAGSGWERDRLRASLGNPRNSDRLLLWASVGLGFDGGLSRGSAKLTLDGDGGLLFLYGLWGCL